MQESKTDLQTIEEIIISKLGDRWYILRNHLINEAKREVFDDIEKMNSYKYSYELTKEIEELKQKHLGERKE